MGYYMEQFGFNVPDSKLHMLDLIIEPSMRGDAVYFQVHRMKDETVKVFWNFTPEGRELIRCFQEFAALYNLPTNISVTEILAHPAFPKTMHALHPIEQATLTRSQFEIVKDLYDHGLAQEVNKPRGLDGAGITLRIYGESTRQYSCWCVLPKEWSRLRAFIDLMMDCAQLDRRF